MENKFDRIQEALDRSDLTITDLSKIGPASRSTLHNWKSGVKAPSGFYYRVTLGWIGLIEQAVAKGRLPLKDKMNAAEKLHAVKEILREVKSGY
jgi:hypothetical protein